MRWFHGLLLGMMLFGLAGCDSNPSQPSAACVYTVTPTAVSFGAEGGQATVTVSTGAQCSWTARADVGWVAINSGASGVGPGSVVVTAVANGSTTTRSGGLTVAGQAVSVSQQGLAPCTYVVTPEARAFGAAGGTGTFDVATAAHCAWTVAGLSSWIAIAGGGSASGNGTVTYVVGPNLETETRHAALTVGGASHAVTQTAAGGCGVTIAPAYEVFPASGGRATFDLATASDCVWMARSAVGWMRVTEPPGGLGTGSRRVSYEVDASGETDARTGTMTVADRVLTVTQAGTAPCTYQVTPVEFSLCLSGGWTQSISVDTGVACTWTAAASVPWLSVLAGGSGFGPGRIEFTFTSNYLDARQGHIAVRWPTPTVGQNVIVRQAGCLYAVSPASFDVPAGGGDFLVNVFSSPTDPNCGGPLQDACSWRAEPAAPWVTILSLMPSNGDNPVRFRVDANLTGSARTTTITVGTRTIAVRQAGS
jgi:hypothetical protein